MKSHQIILPILIASSLACTNTKPYTVTQAKLPKSTTITDPQTYLNSKDYEQWTSSLHQQTISLQDYYNQFLPDILINQENTVISPLNIYLSLCTLAEITNQDTRQQILTFLHQPSMTEAQETYQLLFNQSYTDNPLVKEKLAASLWIDQTHTLKKDALNQLSDAYHTSIYQGDLKTPEMNNALQQWTNQQTENLLTDYTKDMQFSDQTIAGLITTIYYKAKWQNTFPETEDKPFHGTKGEQETSFLKQTDTMYYQKEKGYQSVSIPIQYSGSMTIVLPDEDTSIPDILKQYTVSEFIPDESSDITMINLAIPSFDVSASMELSDVLKQQGITDVFDSQADFSPLTDEDMFLSKINHAARVMIDEDGVTGAAYTEMMMEGTAFFADQPIDFIADHPFLFLVTDVNGTLLFAGTVQNC